MFSFLCFYKIEVYSNSKCQYKSPLATQLIPNLLILYPNWTNADMSSEHEIYVDMNA